MLYRINRSIGLHKTTDPIGETRLDKREWGLSMKQGIKEMIDSHLHLRISFYATLILLCTFFMLIVITAVTTSASMNGEVRAEVQAIAEKNNKIVQSVFDEVVGSIDGVLQYLDGEYNKSTTYNENTPTNTEVTEGTQNAVQPQYYSQIYGVPCSKSSYEAELVMARYFEMTVNGNEAIINAGAGFEPYCFDGLIEEYSVYCRGGATSGRLDDYDVYSQEVYYSMAKEAKGAVTTPACPWEGVDMISVSAPVMYQNQVMGVVSYDISLNYLEAQMQYEGNFSSLQDALIMGDGQVACTTFDNIAVGESLLNLFGDAASEVTSSMSEGIAFTVKNKQDNQFYAFVPVNAAGATWWTVVRLSIDEMELVTDRLVITLMVVSFLFMLLIVFLLATLIRRSLKPVAELDQALSELEQGNILAVEIHHKGKDELGHLANGLRELSNTLKNIVADEIYILESYAKGDFAVESRIPQRYVGDFKKVLAAVGEVSQKISYVFNQIDGVSNQVANGAEQISSSSQTLAQGANEQAASVEEMAAAVSEVSSQIESNFETLRESNTQTEEVFERIEVSNDKMKEMLATMDEINTTAEQISGIAKNIEDIAFQTNILALNAAIEAARAGTAGKGFAVVADEVRNLASKTAEASQYASKLIENTAQVAVKGKEIANETADSFEVVYKGVKEISNRNVNILESAKLQHQAMQQTKTGIDQISKVVQSNSAASEENAVASRELSDRSKVLKSLVMQFQYHKQVEDRDQYLVMDEGQEPLQEPNDTQANLFSKY